MSTPSTSHAASGGADTGATTPAGGIPATGLPPGLMTVGEMAERVALSHRTVRYYDDEGLLPARRSPGNYRLYGEDALAKMLTIRRLKPLGFTLDEMREVLALLDAVSSPTAEDDPRPRRAARAAGGAGGRRAPAPRQAGGAAGGRRRAAGLAAPAAPLSTRSPTPSSARRPAVRAAGCVMRSQPSLHVKVAPSP
ncbi:MAG: MerR family transcriptional regulator [Quadrisphaera sp.]